MRNAECEMRIRDAAVWERATSHQRMGRNATATRPADRAVDTNPFAREAWRCQPARNVSAMVARRAGIEESP